MDDMDNENSLPRKRRKIRRKKFHWGRLLGLIIIVVLLVSGLFWGSVWVYDNIINPPHAKVVAADETIEKDAKLNERINILLMGIDDGDSEAAATEPKRTDALILLSFDPKKNKVAVLSIPRDTKVILPGHKDPQKINAAYAFGGVVMAKQTVANLLHVPIHYYALANWRGFIDIVNLMGGVDIYVDRDMYYEDPYADLVIDIKHGYQHMDGETAGKYVRFRSDELGDIGRVQRQQKFLKAAAEQLFSIQNVAKVGTVLKAMDKYIETDLNTLTLLRAANSFKIFGDDKMRSCMLYGKFEDTANSSYWATTKDSVNKSLDELEIPRLHDPEEEQENKEEDNKPIKHLQPETKDAIEAKKKAKQNQATGQNSNAQTATAQQVKKPAQNNN